MFERAFCRASNVGWTKIEKKKTDRIISNDLETTQLIENLFY
jgi:hypothetical protein